MKGGANFRIIREKNVKVLTETRLHVAEGNEGGGYLKAFKKNEEKQQKTGRRKDREEKKNIWGGSRSKDRGK